MGEFFIGLGAGLGFGLLLVWHRTRQANKTLDQLTDALYQATRTADAERSVQVVPKKVRSMWD